MRANESSKMKEIQEILYLSKEKYNPKGAKTPYYLSVELEHIESRTSKLSKTENTIDFKSIKNKFNKGDILYGKLRPYLRKYYYADFEGVCSTEIWVLKPTKLSISKYLFYLIQTEKFNAVANVSSGSRMPRADWDYMKNIVFYLPEIREQKQIVSIIEKWDKYIELLDKKIEIKKNTKKYLQQVLLTGKVRLKGYEGEWEERKLGEIGEFKTSSVDKKIKDGEQMVSLVNYMDVYKHKRINNSTKEDFMKVSAKDEQLISNNLLKGDILFTPSSETPEDIGHSVVVEEDLFNTVYSYHVMRFRPNIQLDLLFSHYFCNHPAVLRQFSRYSSGVTRFTLSLDSFSRVKVVIPPLPEQKAISSILTKSDKEIKTLEKQKQLIEQQRKYLINNLVTGKIRINGN